MVKETILTTKQWHKHKSLGKGRHGTQAIVYKDKIYMVAGCGNRRGEPELSSLELFYFEK